MVDKWASDTVERAAALPWREMRLRPRLPHQNELGDLRGRQPARRIVGGTHAGRREACGGIACVGRRGHKVACGSGLTGGCGNVWGWNQRYSALANVGLVPAFCVGPICRGSVLEGAGNLV